MQVTDPFIGRYPNAPNQDMIQVVGPGGGVLWRLSQASTTWFSGTGAPSVSAQPGALSGNLYLDTASGNVWQFNGSIWTEVEAGGSANPTPNWLNVKAYGAVGNGRYDKAQINAGGSTVTLQNKVFAQTDVGKPILITGGSVTQVQSAALQVGTDLWTTISSVATNGLSATIATPVSLYYGGNVFGENNSAVFWSGTDDTTAIQAAINAASETQSVVYFPPGVYIYSKQLTNTGSNLAAFVGDGPGSSILLAQNPAVATPAGCISFTTEYPFQIRNLWVRGPGSATTVAYTAEVEIEQGSSSSVAGASILGTSGAENFVISDTYAPGLYFLLFSTWSPIYGSLTLKNCHAINTYNGGLQAFNYPTIGVSDCTDDGQMFFKGSDLIVVTDCAAVGGIIAPGATLTGCNIFGNQYGSTITTAFEGSKFSFCNLNGGNWTNGFYQSNGFLGRSFIASLDHCECNFVQYGGTVSKFFTADLTQGDVSHLLFENCKVAQIGNISQAASNTSPVNIQRGIHDTSGGDTNFFSQPLTAGNAVIVGVVTSGSGTATVSDGHNTYNQIGSTITSGTYSVQFFLALNVSTATSYTVTPSAGTSLATYTEMKGVVTSSALDGSVVSTTGTVGAGGTTSLGITTGQADDYVVSLAFVSASTGTAVTQKSPFVGPVLSPASAVGVMSMGTGVALKAGTLTASWGLAGQSTADYVVANLALKVSASQFPATTSYYVLGEGSSTDFSSQVSFLNCSSTISRNSASLHLQATNVSVPGGTTFAYGTPPGMMTLINFLAYDYFTGALTPPANGFNLSSSNAYFLNSQANTSNALLSSSVISGVGSSGDLFSGAPVSILPLDSPTNSGVSNKTGQTGTIASTTLVNVAAGDSGLWRISFYEETTSAGTGGTATPAFAWTDDNGSETLTYGTALDLTGTTPLAGSVMVRAVGGASGTTISYSVTVAGATGSPVYSSFVSVERIS